MGDKLPLKRDVEAILNLPSVPLILDVICRMTGMGFAAVARVTPERWVTCAALDHVGYGLGPGDELDVQTTICRDVQSCRSAIVIEDVESDPAYRDHDTPRRYGFRSYISVPIIDREEKFFGTLCAMGPEPRRLNTPETLSMFALYAELIAAQLDAGRDLRRSQRELRRERHMSRLREESIAMLGHDLRNPIASIISGARILERSDLDPRGSEIVHHIRSSALRMNDLIEDLLDLARGRLGGGITLERQQEVNLREELEQVIAEMRSISSCPIETRLEIGPVHCDRKRLGQLLSNLLSNAVTHGAKGRPVRVTASQSDEAFTLSVINRGDPIPPNMLRSIFEPFQRGRNPGGSSGLGLGLYIASEIAKAHGGELTASSTDGETRFTFTMQTV